MAARDVSTGHVHLAGGHRIVAEKLRDRHGKGFHELDAIHVCPHHPERGFVGEVAALKIDCDCRKPGTALIERACRDLAIDPSASWLVGDTSSDVEAGRRAGLRTVLVRTGHAGRDGKWPLAPDATMPDVKAAVDWIADNHGFGGAE